MSHTCFTQKSTCFIYAFLITHFFVCEKGKPVSVYFVKQNNSEAEHVADGNNGTGPFEGMVKTFLNYAGTTVLALSTHTAVRDRSRILGRRTNPKNVGINSLGSGHPRGLRVSPPDSASKLSIFPQCNFDRTLQYLCAVTFIKVSAAKYLLYSPRYLLTLNISEDAKRCLVQCNCQ